MSRRLEATDCDQQVQAGAYVLSALASEELERYQEHLHGCPICRDEVDELQPAVDALPGTAPRVEVSGDLLERIMTTVRSEAELLNAAGPQADRAPPVRRRRRTRRLALSAAIATMAAAIAVGALVFVGGSSNGTRVTTASVAASAPGAHAELRQSGARAELVVSGLPQPPTGRVYQVWVAPPHRAPQPTDALFSVTTNGNGSVDVPGSLRGIQRLMVTAEPLGGSAHPTSPPIIVATLKPA